MAGPFLDQWDSGLTHLSLPGMDLHVILGDARKTLPAWDGRAVSGVEVLSEKGVTLRLLNPWKPGLIEFPTKAGVTYRLEPPDGRPVVARSLG